MRSPLQHVALLVLVALGSVACSLPQDPYSTGPTSTIARPRLIRSRFLAFGDSLTGGVTSPGFTTLGAGVPQSYPFKMLDLLRERYPHQTFEMINAGTPGEALEDAVLRFPGVLRANAPEVVLLLHGVNDITFYGLRGVPGALMNLAELARLAKLGGAEVIVATLPPQRTVGFRAADPAVIAAYNDGIRIGARAEGIPIVDLAVEFGDLSLIGVDGVHPTEAGYDRIAALFVEAVVSLYEDDPRR